MFDFQIDVKNEIFISISTYIFKSSTKQYQSLVGIPLL